MPNGPTLYEIYYCAYPGCGREVNIPEESELNDWGFLCSQHRDIVTELENTQNRLKAEIRLLQAEKLKLIEEREDKVYLMKEKLSTWMQLIKDLN